MKPRHLFASDALRCPILTQYLTHPCSLSFKLASENHSAQAFTHRIREFQCSWSGRWSDLLIHCAILVRVSCAELKRQCDKPIAGNWTLHSGQVTLMNFSLKTPQYLNACMQSAVLQNCIVRVSRYTLGVQQISLGMQRGGRQGRAVLHVQSTELRSQLQRTQQAIRVSKRGWTWHCLLLSLAKVNPFPVWCCSALRSRSGYKELQPNIRAELCDTVLVLPLLTAHPGEAPVFWLPHKCLVDVVTLTPFVQMVRCSYCSADWGKHFHDTYCFLIPQCFPVLELEACN